MGFLGKMFGGEAPVAVLEQEEHYSVEKLTNFFKEWSTMGGGPDSVETIRNRRDYLIKNILEQINSLKNDEVKSAILGAGLSDDEISQINYLHDNAPK